jgi:glycosyltransferase involved in cell wall biosynthesis
LKILLLTGSLNQGGAEMQLLNLARLMMRNGLHPEVVAITDHDYYLPYVKENKIRYSYVSNEGSNLSRLLRAVRLINSKRPDIVISYIQKVSKVAILARCLSFFRFKLIISERTSLVKPWRDLFYFNLAIFASNVTVNSMSKYNYIQRRFPHLKKRTVFIPNLLDLERFLKIDVKSTPDRVARLSYVGRISPEKNILNLIRAIKMISDKGYMISLSIYGEANNHKYLSEIQQLIISAQVEGIIKYRGPMQDVTQIYFETDLLCLVSFYEGFSNVLAEAMASGLSIVASNIDENKYLIKEGENGFLVDPNNPKCIADGIEKFLKCSPLQKYHISSNNRLRAKVLFNQELVFKIFMDLCN